jgi:2-iminoacetate synthase ThiH
MLDNIPHIKAYWVMMTPRIAQVAQRFGAGDLDGAIVEERIYHDAGATTTQGLRRAELLQLIRRAGPRTHGARHALSPGGADGSDLYSARRASVLIGGDSGGKL